MIRRAARMAVLIALALGEIAADASGQRPERQHDILVPGLGVRLREGWQLVFYDGCRYAIPATWRPSADRSQVIAADGSSLAIWSSQISDWPHHKSRLKASYSIRGHVREDTDSKLWIESQESGRTEHVVAVTDGRTVCEALLDVRNVLADRDDIAAIIESIGGTVGWSADLK